MALVVIKHCHASSVSLCVMKKNGRNLLAIKAVQINFEVVLTI
jgi:hypothetical protein